MSLGPVLNETITQDFTSGLQLVSERNYEAKLRQLKYMSFCRQRPTKNQREHIAWILTTARLKAAGQGGQGTFGTADMAKMSYSVRNMQDGLEVLENQLTDLDGNGVDIATEWNAAAGAEMAYCPQRETVALLLYGTTGLAFDGKAFFATDHPVHPKKVSNGTYSNLLTGASYAIHPDDTDAESALNALTKIKKHISDIKDINGIDPMYLEFVGILHPPALGARLAQITNAKFIAQVTNGAGAGSGDVEALVKYQGMGNLIEMPELASSWSYNATIVSADDESETTAAVTGNDKAYFVLCRKATQSEVGGMVWFTREPFAIQHFNRFNTGGVELAKSRKMLWNMEGRVGAGYGFPYHIIRVDPTV